MRTINERLRECIKLLNLSPALFEREAKLGASWVYHFNGKSPKKTLEQISAVFPQISWSYILDGKGEKLLPVPPSAENIGAAIAKGMFSREYVQLLLDKVKFLEDEIDYLRSQNTTLNQILLAKNK